MGRDYLYENAPLIEVIAEVRWALVAVSSIPGGGVDPHFDIMSDKFIESIEGQGYGIIERLAPPDIPIEILAGKPVWRIRRQPNAWPLYQVGPGVFTCNIVPRYNGWQSFRPTIFDGVSSLARSFPIPLQYVNIEAFALKYVDGFSRDHGVVYYTQFLSRELGVTLTLRKGLLSKFGLPNSGLEFAGRVKFHVGRPEASEVYLSFQPGKKNNVDALIAEFSVHKQGAHLSANTEAICSWLDDAHDTLSDMFEFMCSDSLKARMGPAEKIGGENTK